MQKSPTYKQIAQNFELWSEYVDSNGEMSREEFDSLSLEEKIKIQQTAFGADLVECVYCDQKVLNSEIVPEIDDDEEWERLATSHASDCEWILTRAHRQEYFPVKVYKFTARENLWPPSGDESTYTFRAYELASGEVLVPYESTNDGWFESLDDVNACGTDEILEYKYEGYEEIFTLKEIQKSVQDSASEFGKSAVPNSLYRFLN